MPIHQPSRRAVIRAGAWTAPVIVAAAAAPAMAASTMVLAVANGATAVRPGNPSDYDALAFNQFTVVPTGTIIAGALTMTIAASKPGQSVYVYFYDTVFTQVRGWTPVGQSETALPSINYTHNLAATPTEPAVANGNAVLVVDEGYGSVYGATVTVTVSAPGYPSVVRMFTSTRTPRGLSGARNSGPLPRPPHSTE